jgi:Mn2+/Fe2+ NRAMP family transporter
VDKGLGEREYRFERWDVYAGAFACTLIAFFVIVTTAATLNAHGQPADTVTDVGQALHPLAGDFAANLFAIGLLNASLLAAIVLPLSTAYAVCGAFGWERSVTRRPGEARAFFGLFAALVVIGTAAVLMPGLPLLVLMFLPNVVGGILLPVILVLMLKLVNDRRIMGRWTNSPRQNAIAWVATVVMIVLAAVYAVIAVLQAVGIVHG